ncbi:MAG: hypothetical protein MJD61_16100 [Proteobacteria bacterium]|nr:hypothetical protein [Pseudomonadota bacterium]
MQSFPVSALLSLARTALLRAKKLVACNRRSRFDEYLRSLENYSEPTAEFVAVYRKQKLLRRAMFEASAQCYQLHLASLLWDEFDAGRLRTALRHILAGPALDPKSDDKPRDTLLELVAAAVLYDIGFDVGLTDGHEDVVLRQESLGRGAAECKRPRAAKNLRANCNRLARQLRERRAVGSKYGMAVIGLDRLSGLFGDAHEAETTEDATQAMEEITRTVAAQLNKCAVRSGLDREASVAVLVLSGCVLVRQPLHLWTFVHVQPFPLVEPAQMPPPLDALLLKQAHRLEGRWAAADAQADKRRGPAIQ